MAELKGACIIGQSGGPTSVINASAYGVIRTALDNPNITGVYGAEHGIVGVLDGGYFKSSSSLGSSLLMSNRRSLSTPTMPCSAPKTSVMLGLSSAVRMTP